VNVLRAKILPTILALVLLSLRSVGVERPALDVVVITIDTLRADHLGCYGYASIQTPSIDQLARGGVRFTHAYTPVPITLPAHTALMTGEFPPATGVHDFSGNRLPPTAVTVAKVLRSHGYTTGAFIGSAVLDSRFGLNQGFDMYFDHFEFGRSEEVHLDAIERRGDHVIDEALKWLKLNPKRPLFLWVHLYDPHAPYNPPAPYSSRYCAHPYDGEIAFADAQVGRFFTFLRQQGLFEDSLVVLASDHGESLGEHGEKTHGFFIYNSTLHVPLIVKMPGAVPRVVQDEVSLVDVMPTLLQALGIPIPPSVQGRSLLSLVLGRPAENTSNLYAESYPPLLHFGWNLLRSIEWRGLKYIETTRPELYDTRTDPKELHNLFHARQAVAQEMSDRLHGLVRRFTPPSNASSGAKELTDPALLESLRSLGYVAVSAGNITDASGKSLPDPKDRIQVYELVSAALTDDHAGRYNESLRKLEEAERAEPDSLTVHFLMARDYLRLNDFSHAREYFQSVLKLDPKNAVAAYDLGLCRLQTGDLDGAEESFGRALELDPTNFTAAFNLGVVYTRREQPEAAIRAFQQAVKILPDYAEAHEALGELYLYLKRPDDAARELERAVAIAPKMAKAHYHLGRAYAALGLQEKAQQEFDRGKAP
jgi:arylsulfatase A-like enzyme/Tfp pilus assembly protein PilF